MWPFVVIACIAVLVGVALLSGGAYLLIGPGPVRSRGFHRARRALEQGDWRGALTTVESLRNPGLPAAWQDKLRILAGESRQAATDAALKEKHYEEALEHSVQAAMLLGTPEADARAKVIDAALAEVRRQFAAGPDATDSVLQLLGRILALQSPCPEARFWQGLCFCRRAEIEPALAALTSACEQAGKTAIDPAYYLGAVLHRAGRPQEGLRHLGDANRIDAGCPFVTWQMGVSLVACGGDAGLAVRALQRALGPRGLPLWSDAPQRAWVEAFPEGRSYVRRLATKYPYTCPVLGGDLNAVILEGQFALAQAHYRQGSFQDAADLFSKLLQNTAPTTALLRGLGLSLARLQRYDQAYKHLRAALEQEQPKDPFTAAYLGLCGAMGRPTQPEDKPKNVAWAVRLLARYALSGDAEYAGVMSAVHAEARSLQLPLAVEDQVQLCDALASVAAVDAAAAQSYHHLAATFPEAVKPIHAWLYVRSASTGYGMVSDHATGCGMVSDHATTGGERDLDLFARTFADPAPARAYFAQRQWNFDDAEYTYLKRGAAGRPAVFPNRSAPITLRRARRSCWRAPRWRRRQGGRMRRWRPSRCCCGWRRRAWRGTTGWPVCSIARATWTGRPRCWPAGIASRRSITGPSSARRSSSSSAATPAPVPRPSTGRWALRGVGSAPPWLSSAPVWRSRPGSAEKPAAKKRKKRMRTPHRPTRRRWSTRPAFCKIV